METNLPPDRPKVRVVAVPPPHSRDETRSSSSLGPHNSSQIGIGIEIPFGRSTAPKQADAEEESGPEPAGKGGKKSK